MRSELTLRVWQHEEQNPGNFHLENNVEGLLNISIHILDSFEDADIMSEMHIHGSG